MGHQDLLEHKISHDFGSRPYSGSHCAKLGLICILQSPGNVHLQARPQNPRAVRPQAQASIRGIPRQASFLPAFDLFPPAQSLCCPLSGLFPPSPFCSCAFCFQHPPNRPGRELSSHADPRPSGARQCRRSFASLDVPESRVLSLVHSTKPITILEPELLCGLSPTVQGGFCRYLWDDEKYPDLTGSRKIKITPAHT